MTKRESVSMKLTYRLGPIPSSTVLPQLVACAAALELEIEALESASADLYFHEVQEELPRRTGITQLVGTEVLSEAVTGVLLAWAKERQQLMKVSPLRHELGNLIMILMGRIMRLKKESISPEHIVSLESLQKRLTALYEDFDHLNVPRY